MSQYVPEVDVHEARRLIDHEAALLIDVREQREWDAGRIADAAFKPMSLIDDWYEDLPRAGTIIMQCRTGHRSARVVQALVAQAGFTNVVNLTGGIVAWTEAGLPVDTSVPE